MMNYDTESPSSSHADGDRQTGDDAKTTDRRNTVNSPSAEEDNGASAADWCAWCGRGSSTDQDFNVDESWPSADDDDECRQRPAYDQLRFCSRSCLSRYKMDLFCRETQRYLQQLQGSDRFSSGIGSDDAKEQRILITPELWSQTEPGDKPTHAVSVDRQSASSDGDDKGTAPRRRRSNGDETGSLRQKVRKINVSDGLAASRRPGRSSVGDGVQSRYLRGGTLTRTPVHNDSTTAGGSVKSESGATDEVTGSRLPEGPTNLNLPWMPPTSTPIPNTLPSHFPRAFFPSPFWPHSPPGFPSTQVRPPSFAAAASMALGFGAAGWPPAAGLVPSTPMFVPYPIPIPLPLPLPIPVPVQIGKSVADTVCSISETRENSGQVQGETNSLSAKSTSDRRNTSVSTTPKLISASSPSTASPADTWNVLDLSVGGARSRSTDAKVVRTDSVTAAAVSSTIDTSPYLARRSLILDAPAVDRKCLGDQALPVGGVRASSLTPVSKRFNHHRRRTTPMPLVKSK